MNNDLIIQQTKNWINSVVIGCNFCPFAAKEMRQNTIRYSIEASDDLLLCLETFIKECKLLDNDSTIETTLLILPNATPAFDDYLQLVDLAEKLITEQDYEGVYQAIANNKSMPVTAEDGIRVMQIIEAAEISSKEGRAVKVDK